MKSFFGIITLLGVVALARATLPGESSETVITNHLNHF